MIRKRIHIVAVLALLWTTLMSGHAAASTAYIHVVKSGDTLASIAQRYYGDPRREIVLVAANGLADATGGIRAGMRLIIPTTEYVRVQPGQTWASLAAHWMGNSRYASLLSSMNNTSAPAEENSQVIVPFILRHIATQNQSINDIAELYYNDNNKVTALKRFNQIRKKRLKRGQVVLVPMDELVLSPQARRAIEKESGKMDLSADIHRIQRDLNDKMKELEVLMRSGAYVEAIALGNQFLGTPALGINQMVSAQRSLATAYVAIGRIDLAVRAFRKALKHRPDLVVDSALTSPRVLHALDLARKKAK